MLQSVFVCECVKCFDAVWCIKCKMLMCSLETTESNTAQHRRIKLDFCFDMEKHTDGRTVGRYINEPISRQITQNNLYFCDERKKNTLFSLEMRLFVANTSKPLHKIIVFGISSSRSRLQFTVLLLPLSSFRWMVFFCFWFDFFSFHTLFFDNYKANRIGPKYLPSAIDSQKIIKMFIFGFCKYSLFSNTFAQMNDQNGLNSLEPSRLCSRFECSFFQIFSLNMVHRHETN